MALVIEDGSIVAGADSWITVDEWEAYAPATATPSQGQRPKRRLFSARLSALSARDTRSRVIGSRRRRRPAFLDTGGRRSGASQSAAMRFRRTSRTRRRKWRGRSMRGQTHLQTSRHPTHLAAAVAGTRSKAGPVETETTYHTGGAAFSATSMNNYTAVKALLSPYLLSGSGQVRIFRG